MDTLRNVKGLLLDIAGTVIMDDKPLPGVRRAMDAFRSAELPHLFVSNTTSRTRKQLAESISASGVSVASNRIFTAPVAADQFLNEQGHHRCFFCSPRVSCRSWSTVTTLRKILMPS